MSDECVTANPAVWFAPAPPICEYSSEDLSFLLPQEGENVYSSVILLVFQLLILSFELEKKWNFLKDTNDVFHQSTDEVLVWRAYSFNH